MMHLPDTYTKVVIKALPCMRSMGSDASASIDSYFPNDALLRGEAMIRGFVRG